MEVVVYSSKGCGFCTKQKEFLTEKGIAFEERDIDTNAQHFQEFKELKGAGVPFTIVKEAGEIVSTITGFKREKLSKILIQE
ncbi:glutaredoxin family protein [Lysinibacillus xylanilyticus]|uniref:glutaredoxin family protein n=1 Tax=Lysinibacillus xylanilyticus TaxID=582475 RepID=UPI002B24197B|nr:glutaredoxin family protein [Lysinibacillus xylanilyticus]MEB2301547.1 glutaredoxin family protein [Lysinibacillus xylanilyticus]